MAKGTLPAAPDVPHLELAPDWVSEVLSPSTRALDRGAKLGVYAESHVSFAWFVEPLALPAPWMR